MGNYSGPSKGTGNTTWPSIITVLFLEVKIKPSCVETKPLSCGTSIPFCASLRGSVAACSTVPFPSGIQTRNVDTVSDRECEIITLYLRQQRYFGSNLTV